MLHRKFNNFVCLFFVLFFSDLTIIVIIVKNYFCCQRRCIHPIIPTCIIVYSEAIVLTLMCSIAASLVFVSKVRWPTSVNFDKDNGLKF